MTRTTAKTAALVAAIALVLVLGTRLGSRADGVETGETTEAKIERAMSAGSPRNRRISKNHRQGRAGTHGSFT
jgi:hypothetical protein